MEKEQFDEFLGGTVQLPRDVQSVHLAAARASEIAAMTYSLGRLKSCIRFFEDGDQETGHPILRISSIFISWYIEVFNDSAVFQFEVMQNIDRAAE